MKTCFMDNCTEDVRWYIWVDGSVACDTHAPGDYSEEITREELRDLQ